MEIGPVYGLGSTSNNTTLTTTNTYVSGALWVDSGGTAIWPCQPYQPYQPYIVGPAYTLPGFSDSITIWETPVTLKAKQFAVIAVGTGSIVGAHDDEAEAVAHAGRLAAKNDAEYLVLKPVRLLRQKPVDIEDVAL